jgi:hypothetical protein
MANLPNMYSHTIFEILLLTQFALLLQLHGILEGIRNGIMLLSIEELVNLLKRATLGLDPEQDLFGSTQGQASRESTNDQD